MIRRVAALMLTCFTAVTVAAPVCAGWQPTPSERMACCDTADHHCEAGTADDCCAEAEQRQNVESVVSVLLPSMVVMSTPKILATEYVAAPATLIAHSSNRSDTYLLDSVFRI